jgi:hypothetical protein
MPWPERNTDRQADRHTLTSGRCGRDARPHRLFPNATPPPALTSTVPLIRAAFPLSRILGSGRTCHHYLSRASAPPDRNLRTGAETIKMKN